ncbi:MAG: Uma2 family endonuclease [Anaerolineae bacterium]|nr:Uma2 family endonuclease [Anaerolineae bacterium]
MVLQRLSLEEFEAFAHLPENDEKTWEMLDGEIVEKMPSNPYCSYIAARILIRLGIFLLENDIGFVTGESGGYEIGDDVYAPDVAYISRERAGELARSGFNRVAPDLAVEVVSPTDSERRLRLKIFRYLASGTRVWVVYPEDLTVEVYAPGQPVLILGRDGVLTAPDLLPGFELPVADIFPEAPSVA